MDRCSGFDVVEFDDLKSLRKPTALVVLGCPPKEFGGVYCKQAMIKESLNKKGHARVREGEGDRGRYKFPLA